MKKKSLAQQKILVNWKDIGNWLVLLYVFFTLFTPADNFGIKKIAFILILVLSVYENFNDVFKKDFYFIAFFGAVLIVILSIISIFLGIDARGVLSRAFSGAYVCAYFFVKNRSMQFEVILMSVLRLMALVMVVCVLLDLTTILRIYNNPFLNWMHTSGNAMIGSGKNFSFYYLIFFKTSPLLYILLGYALVKKKYFDIIISAAAIFLSGTRANVFALIIFLGMMFLFVYKNKKRKALFCILGILLGLCLLPIIIPIFKDIFSSKSDSDSVRTGHLLSIFKVFRENPISIFIGTGFNSYFYSSGIKQMTNTIELSYWDLFRQVGLIGFVPLMFFYIYPIFKLWNTKYRHISLIVVIFSVISYTNPFLYSSTGALLYVYAYSKVFIKYSKEKQSRRSIIYKSGKNNIKYLIQHKEKSN